MKRPPIQQAYDILLSRYGRQHWWPARTRLEMMLGAILTQNAAWINVEKAIANLKSARVLRFDVLEQASQKEIAEWIRPAGYFNQKADYIKCMTEKIRERFDGSLQKLFSLNTDDLRRELLSWKGVGPETADSILLYAGKRPAFVVDAYTRRICSRHGWCDNKVPYDTLAKLFTDHLPADVQLYNEYHALIVRIGKDHCKTKPECSVCPLEPLL